MSQPHKANLLFDSNEYHLPTSKHVGRFSRLLCSLSTLLQTTFSFKETIQGISNAKLQAAAYSLSMQLVI
jgi:hypothetical protein